MICAACLGAKKINGEDCPACKGEGQVDHYETPSLAEVLEGDDLDQERVLQEFIEKYGAEVVRIDLSNTEPTFFNPLYPDGEPTNKLTVDNLIGPWGEVRPYEEVSQDVNITYEEWKYAADKIDEFRKVLNI